MKKKRKKTNISKTIKSDNPASAPPQPGEDEKALDFGGLPQRDLKKNLGCG